MKAGMLRKPISVNRINEDIRFKTRSKRLSSKSKSLTNRDILLKTDALCVGVNKKNDRIKNDTQSYTSYTYMGAYQYRTYPTLNLRNKQISVCICVFFLEFSVLSWFLQGRHYEPQNKVPPSYELTRKMHIPSFPYNQYCNKKSIRMRLKRRQTGLCDCTHIPGLLVLRSYGSPCRKSGTTTK
jgi:hypothetical protein